MRDTLWNDFRTHILRSSNTLNHLIAINIAVFLVFGILWVVLSLAAVNPGLYDHIVNWFAFPSAPMSFLYKPWSIITYQFVHAGPFHLLFNMLVFITAGRIFREFLGDKKLLATYLIGGAVGALVYMLAYNIFPAFRGMNVPLVGASASILAVLAAAATLVPTYTIQVILIGPVKLIYVALFFFLVAVLSLAGSNAGGNFAHIGGVLWGFLYIKSLQSGRDLGAWLTNLLARIGKLFQKKAPVRIHYYNERGKQYTTNKISQEEVDTILDKIARSGYESLTQHEKDVLFRASKENQ